MDKGWNSFTINPDESNEARCRVCDSLMEVNREVNGPTGFAEAMAGGKHLHDHFFCPNSDNDWHRQALVLLKLAEKTPSKILELSLKDEAKKIIETKKATKVVYEWLS